MDNVKWENVYVFVSSTFNDMHAERDYLVKRVFPQLRLWCAKRRLKLIDIDLRWGVSEEDATKNKRVVDVCMNNINKCRPFFLGFLGQRRGWVPKADDINLDTYKQFPQLQDYLGNFSITELEIIHALMHPLDTPHSNVMHAFFYFRNASYLRDISDPKIYNIYQPVKEDSVFTSFKSFVKKSYPVCNYTCKWNDKKITSELSNVNGEDLSQGRLDHFMVDHKSLKEVILENLKTAILKEFPNHDCFEEVLTPLEQELFHQDTFLFQACDSYIPRLKEEQKILDYIYGDRDVPFVLKAKAGSGKTSMLAHLISEKKLKGKVFYRFAGTSIDSSNAERTLKSLALEMKEAQVIEEDAYLQMQDQIILNFSALLAYVKEDITIVIDALDQWDKAAEDMYWLSTLLPKKVKLIVSIRSDCDEKLLEYFKLHEIKLTTLEEMHLREEKVQFIKQYMGQYLKDISDDQIDLILNLEGIGNPLYLKIVLNELRIHGSFDTLLNHLKTDYGKTPIDAFEKVIQRLEAEDYSVGFEDGTFVCVFLGVLAYSLGGMDLHDYVDVFRGLEEEFLEIEEDEIMDEVYEIVRHLSPYLSVDGDHVDFLYDSLRKAVQNRYRPMEEIFHRILRQTYLSIYATFEDVYQTNAQMRTLLIKILHHSLYCGEEFFSDVMEEIAIFYPAICNLQASMVSQYLFKAAEKGYKTSLYKEMAYALQSASLYVDTNPAVVFYELKQRVNNEITQHLIEQAKESLKLLFYAPMDEQKNRIQPYRELAFLNLAGNTKSILAKEYIVYATNTILWKKEDSLNSMLYLQNIETEKIESVLQLPYTVRRFNVHENYIYVVSAPVSEYEQVYMEIYEMPTLRKVMSHKVLQEVEKNLFLYTFAHGYNGIMYDVAHSTDLPLRFIVYRINDMTPIIEFKCPKETTTFLSDGKLNTVTTELDFYGPFFHIKSSDHKVDILWHLPSGRCIENKEYTYISVGTSLDEKAFYCYQKKDDKIVGKKYKFYQYCLSL